MLLAIAIALPLVLCPVPLFLYFFPPNTGKIDAVVDQLCLGNSHTLRDSFPGCLKCSTVSLRKLHRRCFLKHFYPEAKVAVRGNSRSLTSKLASSLTESLTAIEDRKAN